MILAQRERLTEAENDRTCFRLEIERLKLQLAKARRVQFGQTSERGKQLVEQLELAIAELEETQAEVEAQAEIAASPDGPRTQACARQAQAGAPPLAGSSAARACAPSRPMRL